MDQTTLVNDASKLIGWLDTTKIKPRAAMWVYNSEADSWRLWIVPANKIDKAEFYLELSNVISQHRAELPGFDISDVEFKLDRHPAVSGLGSMFRIPGIGNVHLTNNRVNGFLLPDGIVLRMAL